MTDHEAIYLRLKAEQVDLALAFVELPFGSSDDKVRLTRRLLMEQIKLLKSRSA